MVVCHCERVSERRIAKAVRSGCTSLGAVCRDTGAGQGCGCCVSSLRTLIEKHREPEPTRGTPHEAA
jgi:bacterioferritin-associated ferredoxin